MRRIFKLVAFLCSVLLIGGCANMTQNNEIKTTLEKAFNTAQGNDLFEVGKQVLDTYAPNEESIYLINTYSKGTTKERDSEAIPWVDLVIKFERNKQELKVKLIETKNGENEASKITDLVYRGKGQYYTSSGELYEPLKDLQTIFESKYDVTFQSLKNQKYRKNEGNNYGLSFESVDEILLEKIFNKIQPIFSTEGYENIKIKEGGFSFSNHITTTNKKQRLRISMTIRSIEKNLSLTGYTALEVDSSMNIE